jgi:1-acyl-sn-glycerol-3-phosphate acyltransferase
MNATPPQIHMTLSTQRWYDFYYCLVYSFFSLGYSYRSCGSRNMPQTGPVLILANHESFLDPLVVGLAVRRRVHSLARSTLFRPEWFGRFLRDMGTLPVDIDGSPRDGLEKSIQVLKSGEPLVVYPEGERCWDGQMQEFKPGICLMLKTVPVPVVPVGIAGAFEAFPRTKKYPRFSPLFWSPTPGAIAAAVGKPILPSQYANLKRPEQLRLFENAVREQITQAEKIARKS